MGKILKIYTDGSHFKHNGGRLGIGGIIVDEDKIINEFSTEITKEYLDLYYKTQDCSNPTMEMLAVLHALYNFKKNIGIDNRIEVYADYQGVESWMNKKWKINKPYIAKIKDDIDSEINNQSLRGRIHFNWIRGHQKDISDNTKWNNYVDLLAKGEKKL